MLQIVWLPMLLGRCTIFYLAVCGDTQHESKPSAVKCSCEFQGQQVLSEQQHKQIILQDLSDCLKICPVLVDCQAVRPKLKTSSLERRQAAQGCGSRPSLSQDTNVPSETECCQVLIVTPVTVSALTYTQGIFLQWLHFFNQRLFQKMH